MGKMKESLKWEKFEKKKSLIHIVDRLILTKSQARKIILHAAGLSKRAQFGKGKKAVYNLIDHLGFVQIGTIYVVERAHHHAIASRVPDYLLEWLEQRHAHAMIIVVFTYVARFSPMADLRCSLPTLA